MKVDCPELLGKLVDKPLGSFAKEPGWCHKFLGIS